MRKVGGGAVYRIPSAESQRMRLEGFDSQREADESTREFHDAAIKYVKRIRAAKRKASRAKSP